MFDFTASEHLLRWPGFEPLTLLSRSLILGVSDGWKMCHRAPGRTERARYLVKMSQPESHKIEQIFKAWKHIHKNEANGTNNFQVILRETFYNNVQNIV